MTEQIWQPGAQTDNQSTPKITALPTDSLLRVEHSTSACQSYDSLGEDPTKPALTFLDDRTAPASISHLTSAASSVPAGRPYGYHPYNDPIVKLCCFFADAPIPTSLLQRGSAKKRRWNKLGEVEEFTPAEAGIEPEITACLSDDTRWNQAVEYLASGSLIASSSEGSTFVVSQELKGQITEHMDDQEKENWRRQAFLIVIQGFPRPFLDPE